MLKLLLQGVQQSFQPIAHVYKGFLAERQVLKTALPLLVLHETYFLKKKWKNTEVSIANYSSAPFLPILCDHTETWKTVHKMITKYEHLLG